MKKTTQKVIVVITSYIIIVVFIAISVRNILIYIVFYFGTDPHYKNAADKTEPYFNKICDYIIENETVFNEFSEYQLSLLNEDNLYFEIEKKGDMQEKRDIVFKYFDEAYARTFEYGSCIMYKISYGSCDILVTYENDGVRDNIKGNEKNKIINDHIWCCWILVR